MTADVRPCRTCGYDETNHKREAHLYDPAPVTADVQRELAEALPHDRGCLWISSDVDAPCTCLAARSQFAADLLPTVQALIADAEKRAAAAALREAAAAYWGDVNFPVARQPEVRDLLRDRAAALDPSGAAEGAGR